METRQDPRPSAFLATVTTSTRPARTRGHDCRVDELVRGHPRLLSLSMGKALLTARVATPLRFARAWSRAPRDHRGAHDDAYGGKWRHARGNVRDRCSVISTDISKLWSEGNSSCSGRALPRSSASDELFALGTTI